MKRDAIPALLGVLAINLSACGFTEVNPCPAAVGDAKDAACIALHVMPGNGIDSLSHLKVISKRSRWTADETVGLKENQTAELPAVVALVFLNVAPTASDGREQIHLEISGRLGVRVMGEATLDPTIAAGEHQRIEVTLGNSPTDGFDLLEGTDSLRDCCEPPPDEMGPLPPCEAGTPAVVPASPIGGASSSSRDVDLVFKICNDSALACTITLDGAMQPGNATFDPGNMVGHFPLIDVADGMHEWSVSCRLGSGPTVASEKARFVSEPEPIGACRPAGQWKARTKYRLTTDLKDVAGDCFVIDKEGVRLDGGKQLLRARRGKALAFSHPATPGLTVLPRGASVGWDAAGGWTVSDGTATQHVHTADVNGDLVLDLGVSFKKDWRFFQGPLSKGPAAAPKFQTTPALADPAAFTDFRFSDIDHDGTMDAVVLSDGGPRKTYWGGGDGFLATRAVNVFATGFQHVQTIDFFDFNVDGALDLITSEPAAAHGLLARDEGTSGGMRRYFDPTITVGTEQGVWRTFVAPLDDKKTVLVLGDPTAMTTVVRRFDQTTFAKVTEFAGALPVGIGDLDGNGTTDIVMLGSSGGAFKSVKLALNNAGTYTVKSVDNVPALTSDGVLVGDVDNDGNLDLVLGPAADSLEIRYGKQGVADFGTPTKFGGGSDWQGEYHLQELRDLDRNGTLDVLTTFTKGMGQRWALFRVDGKTPMLGQQHPTTPTTSDQRYQARIIGDVFSAPATGISVQAEDVTVRDFRAIQDFSVGVLVRGGMKKAAVSSITVEDPDVAGLRVLDGTVASIDSVTVRSLRDAVGIHLVNPPSGTRVSNSTVCDASPNPAYTAIALACSNPTKALTASITGGSNRFRLVQGCAGATSKPCP